MFMFFNLVSFRSEATEKSFTKQKLEDEQKKNQNDDKWKSDKKLKYDDGVSSNQALSITANQRESLEWEEEEKKLIHKIIRGGKKMCLFPMLKSN